MIKNNILLEAIEEALNELLEQFFAKKINDEDLLKILGEAGHYTYTLFLNEALFIQAIRIKKIPKSSLLINMMFGNLKNTEDNIYPDDIKWEFEHGGTRREVLFQLNLKNSLEMYDEFLAFHDERSKIKGKNHSIEEIREKIKEEINP